MAIDFTLPPDVVDLRARAIGDDRAPGESRSGHGAPAPADCSLGSHSY